MDPLIWTLCRRGTIDLSWSNEKLSYVLALVGSLGMFIYFGLGLSNSWCDHVDPSQLFCGLKSRSSRGQEESLIEVPVVYFVGCLVKSHDGGFEVGFAFGFLICHVLLAFFRCLKLFINNGEMIFAGSHTMTHMPIPVMSCRLEV